MLKRERFKQNKKRRKCGIEGQVTRMSDDLISRKALLEEIDLNFIIPILKINMREEHKAVLKIREIIMNMPTAFDKEKVIDELEYDKEMSAKYSTGLRGQGHVESFDGAVSIARTGGINNVLS